MARLEKGVIDGYIPQDNGADFYFLRDKLGQLYFDVLVETNATRFDKSEIIEGYSSLTLSRFVVKKLIDTGEPSEVTFWFQESTTPLIELVSSDDVSPSTEQTTLY